MDRPETNARTSLTRQQQNFLLTEPIARLSVDRMRLFSDDPTINGDLDLQYLALSAIDFVMERSAIEAGAAPEEIIAHVADEARRMQASLTPKQGRRIGQVVLDHLTNARDGHKAFRSNYYDRDRDELTFHDFRLLVLFFAADGSVRFKLAPGAQILTLAMLDIPPEFVQEAEAIMIRRAVERGRFQDARDLAQRARMRSIHYRQFIDEQLFRARRNIELVVWSEGVLPRLDEARTHLNERLQHETALVESIRDSLPSTQGEARTHLIALGEIVDECRARHQELFKRVMTASEEFRDLQVQAFRVRYRRDLPNLDADVLAPLLAAPIGVLSGLGDDLAVPFTAPSPPRLYDLALLFENCTQPRVQRDPVARPSADDLVPIPQIPATFDAEDIRAAQDWLVAAIARNSRLDIATAVRHAEADGLASAVQRCVLFLMLRSWCKEDDPIGVVASLNGTVNHARASGDNLLLEKDAERWPTLAA